MNGGDALVETLVAHGVDQAFTVPGESFLAVLEALRRNRNQIRLVNTRHEAGATFAAEAYGKLALRPAAVFVSRGPGAANAAIGIHTAMQDSTALLLFVGHVPRRAKGREAFQEIDYHRFFGATAKAVMEPMGPEDVADVTARAWRTAMAGRPGPVVVVLPEDVTEGEIAPGSDGIHIPRPAVQRATRPHPDDARAAAEAIAAARRPIVVFGEAVAQHLAHDALVRFLDRSGAGAVAAFRRQDCLANDHPAYLGHLDLTRTDFQRAYWAECDLVVAAGTRLDDITTEEYTLIRPDQTVVHLYPDADAIAATGAAFGIVGDVGAALDAIAAHLPAAPPADRLAWRDRYHGEQACHGAFARPPAMGAVDMVKVVEATARAVAPGTVIATDAGTFGSWIYRHYPWRRPFTQLAPEVGAMGAGVPGGIGAALALPGTPVVVFVGDGGFLMTGQEMVTAVEERLPLKVVVCDNAAYASILIHQHRRYGADAHYGVRIQSPDFAQIARGYGAAAWTVRATAEYPGALAQALAHDGPALIHVLTDLRDGSANAPLVKDAAA